MDKFFKQNKTYIILGVIVLAALYYFGVFDKNKPGAKGKTVGGSSGIAGVGGGVNGDFKAGDESVAIGYEDERNTSDYGMDMPVVMSSEYGGGDPYAAPIQEAAPVLTSRTFTRNTATIGGDSLGGSVYRDPGDYCKTSTGQDGTWTADGRGGGSGYCKATIQTVNI